MPSILAQSVSSGRHTSHNTLYPCQTRGCQMAHGWWLSRNASKSLVLLTTNQLLTAPALDRIPPRIGTCRRGRESNLLYVNRHPQQLLAAPPTAPPEQTKIFRHRKRPAEKVTLPIDRKKLPELDSALPWPAAEGSRGADSQTSARPSSICNITRHMKLVTPLPHPEQNSHHPHPSLSHPAAPGATTFQPPLRHQTREFGSTTNEPGRLQASRGARG